MALWTWTLQTDKGIVQIPIVREGESPLPSKVKAYKAGVGYGEVPLVYPDDVRASKIRVRQGGVTYAVAQDERTLITHTGPWELRLPKDPAPNDVHTLTRSVSLGTTTFNRVTRVEATLTDLYGVFECYDTPLISFSGWDDQITAEAWIELHQGGQKKAESPKFTISCRLTHPGGQRPFVIQRRWQGTHVLGVNAPTPGKYEVVLVYREVHEWAYHRGSDGRFLGYDSYIYGSVHMSNADCSGSQSNVGNVYFRPTLPWARVTSWTEVARG